MLVLIRAEGSLRSAFGGVELDLGPVAPSRGLGEMCRETCDSLCIGFGYVPNDYCLGIFIFISFAAGHFWPEASANQHLGKKRERAPRMGCLFALHHYRTWVMAHFLTKVPILYA
jgi:hypothetical protein